MSKSPVRGVRYTLTIGGALPHAARRRLLERMIAFSRALPQQFDQPLPTMMARLTPIPHPHAPLPPDTVRRLADAVAAWHLRSPLGLCLRRSLLRYHFLRETNLPVRIVFGARLMKETAGSAIGGHAWLMLQDAPYYENPEDYQGFAEIYTYPQPGDC